MRIVDSPEGEALRDRLRANIEVLRPGHPTPIIAVVLGSEAVALAASDALLEQGLLVPAIRPPDRARRAPAACGSPCPRRTPVSRSPSSPRPWPHLSTPVGDGGPVSPRPDLLVVVVGTGTGVGKTWVAAHVLRDLHAEGHAVAARKSAQSFGPEDRTTDAHVLAAATGAEPTDVCPRHRWYTVPMAPPMAAEALGRPAFTVADLAEEASWPAPAPAVGLVETAGGVRSPQAFDGDAVTLIEELQPDIVLLVADAGLGAINLVRLSLDALDAGAHVATPLVFLNRYDPAAEIDRRNRDWLSERLDVEVLSSIPSLVERLRPGRGQRSAGR